MSIETIEVWGIEANDVWSRCFFDCEIITNLTEKAEKNNGLKGLIAKAPKSDPSIREKIYENVLIPLSVFSQLRYEVNRK